MKNKHHLQGKVLSQNDQYVEIELDIGTMRVSRSDVESVEIGAEIKNPEVVTNSGISGESETEVVPETMRHIGEILKDVRAKRFEAVKYSRMLDGERSRATNLRREAASLLSRYEALNGRLRRMQKDDVLAYNNVIASINEASAQISQKMNDYNISRTRKDQLEINLSSYVNAYNEALTALKDEFSAAYDKADTGAFTKDENNFYIAMKEMLEKFDRDFITREMPYYNDGNQIVVDCVINNNVNAKLVLDTGASVVAISNELAARIKNYEVVGGQNVTLTLADGKTVEAVPIILKSIRVGDFTVRNVESVICGTSYGDISEGLLGMTFLNNFMMKIDSQGRKVILEEFRPAIDG